MSDLDDFLGDGCTLKVIRRECSTALSPSNLPGLDFALNPYTRCGHGCTYCYAPYVMRTSPQDWTKDIVAKVNIAQVLAKELPRKRGVIGLGTVTDPYQPMEKEMLLTRKCLEVLSRAGATVSILTKSDLVMRDIDLLTRLPVAEVGLTINTSSDDRASIFEPCAPPPSARLNAVKALSDAGIDTYVFLGPILPGIIDDEPSALIDQIAQAGARRIMVDRLNLRPGMLKRLEERLHARAPERLGSFTAHATSDLYYRNCIDQLRAACQAHHLRCVDAF